MKNKKALSMVCALLLVCVLSVAGTLAYLSATTNEVKNTFVASTLATLKLDESKANQDATDNTKYVLDPSTRVTSNNYKVTPGVDLPKDPVVTVTGLEQKAYLYVEVIDNTPDTLTWAMDGTWRKLSGVVGKNGGEIYAYNTTISAASGDQQFKVMANDEVKVATTYEQGSGDESLSFYAYLCQSAGFADATDAFNKAFN